MAQPERAEDGVLTVVLTEPDVRSEALIRARRRIEQGPVDAVELARSVFDWNEQLRDPSSS